MGNRLNNPKRHHYLPRFYLNKFCENGLLWVFDRKKNEYRKQPPINTAVKNKYYTIIDEKGIHYNEIEEKLSIIEGETKPIIDKIEQHGYISLEDKAVLSIFVALFRTRVPEFEKEMDSQAEKVIKHLNKSMVADVKKAKELIKQFAKNDEQKNISPQELLDFVQKEDYTVKFPRIHSLEMMSFLTRELPLYFVQMDWQFWHTGKKGSYVTSDNPFILTPPEKYNGPFGIFTKGAKKICPLSKDVCLVMCDHGERVMHMQVNRKQVRSINTLVTMNCERFLIGNNQNLLENLVNATQIEKREETKG
jgi:hypothetical protein